MSIKKYMIDTSENRDFLANEAQNLLVFGHRYPSPGGSSWWLGDDGVPMKDQVRGTWISARMVHVYSLGVLLGHPGSGELVDAGMRGLFGELRDADYSGWYVSLLPDGSPNDAKQCYAQAFVMLAATSALLAGRNGAMELLRMAQEVFDRYFWDEKSGMTVDTWNRSFTELDPYRGLNANMHTVEAFLAVADVTGDESYRVRAGRIIEHVVGWAGGNGWRIPEHYSSDWIPDLECNADKKGDQFKPYGATPGHSIEWARLITQWCLSTYSGRTDCAESERYLAAAQSLYNRAIADAWNADGAPGIVYTTDWNGKPVVRDRMHWTLAEAINTSAVLYRVTGEGKYADDYAQFLQYADEKVIDHEHGSWFHQLDEENNVIGTIWPGKSDIYHALQAMILPYCLPSHSIAPAVKNREFVK